MAKIVGGVTATPTPKVDAALDPNSTNAVQNGAVARRVLSLENGAYQLSERMTAIEKDLDTVDELANSANELGATVAKVSTGMASLSTRVTDLADDVEGHSEQIAEVSAAVEKKQNVLVSGQNIKTINGKSVLGDGDIDTSIPVDGALDANSTNPVQNKVLTAAFNQATQDVNTAIGGLGSSVHSLSVGLGNKQDKLESGTNIKTVNGQSLLGSGDITIEGGGGGASITVDDAFNPESTNPVQNKVITAALGEAQGTLTALAKQTTPAVTSADNGKVLQVVDGVWTAVTVADSTIKTYVDEYISSALEGEY